MDWYLRIVLVTVYVELKLIIFLANSKMLLPQQSQQSSEEEVLSFLQQEISSFHVLLHWKFMVDILQSLVD